MASIPKQAGLAALDAEIAAAGPGVAMDVGGPVPTVDCKVCGYTIDAATGEPVEEIGAMGAPPAPPLI